MWKLTEIANSSKRLLGSKKRAMSSEQSANSGLTMHSIAKVIAPPLTHASHKGEHGRIAIIGGSKEYTGAPYFAGISALKVGAEIVHVFCHPDAATAIKCYSPDLMVHPVLNPLSPRESSDAIESWLERQHALVIGPGLGRDSGTDIIVRSILAKARTLQLPIAVDADAFYFIAKDLDMIKGYEQAILTPNKVEFSKLLEAAGLTDGDSSVQELCKHLGDVTIIRKGEQDLISNGTQVIISEEKGSPRRIGGQGDILSGTLGVLSYWAHRASDSPLCQTYSPTLLASYAACHVTKQCAVQAFADRRRSMLTSDMVSVLPRVVQYYFSE